MGALPQRDQTVSTTSSIHAKLPAPRATNTTSCWPRRPSFEIAETHFETGNFAEAASFTTGCALDLAPEIGPAPFQVRLLSAQRRRSREGAAKLGEFIDQWPQDVNVPEARYLLARTLRQLGRAEEATQHHPRSPPHRIRQCRHRPQGLGLLAAPHWQPARHDFSRTADTLSAVAIYEGLGPPIDNITWRLPIVYQTGLCYERLRQHDRASQSYRDIVDAVTHPKGKEPMPAELTELAKMAEWRLGQLEWSEKTEGQLNRFFSATNAPPASSGPVPAPLQPMIR